MWNLRATSRTRVIPSTAYESCVTARKSDAPDTSPFEEARASCTASRTSSRSIGGSLVARRLEHALHFRDFHDTGCEHEAEVRDDVRSEPHGADRSQCDMQRRDE